MPDLTCSSTPLVYWRVSGASETVLGVDNAKSGICYYVYMYICMYVWIVRMPFKRARGTLFLKKHGFLGSQVWSTDTSAC